MAEHTDMAAVLAALSGGDEVAQIEMAAVVAGDQIHKILKRHAMEMPTAAAAVAFGINVSAQMFVETLKFSDLSVDGGEDGQLLQHAAAVLFCDLLSQAAPGLLRSVGNA